MAGLSDFGFRISDFGFLLAALLACAPSRAADDASFLIGLLLPPEESASASLRQGADLAIAHANQLPGARARLVVRGRPGQWGDDGVEAARMVLDDGARGLIAPHSGAASHLTLQVAGRTAIPVVSLCRDSSVTGAGVPWMVRLAPRSTDEARRILDATALHRATRGLADPAVPPKRAADREHPPAWAAFVPEGRAGREASQDLQQAAQGAGCLLRKPIEIGTNFTQLKPLLNQVLEQKPDGILLWLDPLPAARLAGALRTAPFHGWLAGPGSCQSAEFLQAAGAAAEGFILTAPLLDQPSLPIRQRFADDYRQRYHIEPDMPAALAYDAVSLLAHVLRKVGAESPHRAFPLLQALPGASGTLAFDLEGNRKTPLSLLACRHGKFTILPNAY